MSENRFTFEYTEENILNLDGTPSRFNIVYGDKNVVHTKKNGYSMVKTSDVSLLGDIFEEKGYKVSTFTHKYGEIIGLNIDYNKGKTTKVGEKSYKAIITIPNNGTGCGYLSIQEERKICSNGMTRKSKIGDLSLKVPHIASYPTYLKVIEDSIISFEDIIISSEKSDEYLSKIGLEDHQIRYELNKWFFNQELPENERKSIGSLDSFRELLVTNPDNINSIDRYNQLMEAYHNELNHNKTLSLNLSKYTVLAICTNYLSRRIEKSKSVAPKEIKFQRESKKLQTLLYDL